MMKSQHTPLILFLVYFMRFTSAERESFQHVYSINIALPIHKFPIRMKSFVAYTLYFLKWFYLVRQLYILLVKLLQNTHHTYI